MNWTILRKLQALSLAIVLVFTISLLVIKFYSNEIGNKFNQFYNSNFTTAMQFERIKEVQVDTMLNIRGLQISYLLQLEDQTDGYLTVITANHKQTPELMAKLVTSYQGNPSKLAELKSLVEDYQLKADAFVDAMKNTSDHKAPYEVFKSFVDSYYVLVEFFDGFKKIVDNAALDTKQEIEQAIAIASYVFYLGLLVSLIVSIGLSQLIARGISQAVTQVKNVAFKLSTGLLNISCAVSTQDEMSELATSINTTVERLRSTMSDIKSSGDIVASNSDEVLSYNNQLQKGAHAITDNIDLVVTAIEEMAQTSQNIAQNITQTAAAAGEINDLAGVSLSASQESVKEIEILVNALKETGVTVDNLKAETVNIEKILDVIKAISEQTNLLALNAAIEAARAGEQGRGFAVVADEVRGLAQRSQTSVNEIEALLGSLTMAGDQAQEQMNHSSNIAHSLNDRVLHSNALMEDIRHKVNDVNSQAHEIATSAEEQSTVVVEISKNMHDIKALVDQNAVFVNTSNEKSHEMKNASSHVLTQLDYFTI
ncbi:methyl-accepting chemotaxis protein [Thalassotalea sediminis]|uniref:methyl-accepting chemotaxis protein n=1 Tax=Thalassotalea sediminis TaxID=1759089 RepID=UPI002572E372|nr:methyl-accepting chemotaxis protein [Thalassotalea sediminis]